MSGGREAMDGRARALAGAFDQSFALPRTPPATAPRQFVAIRVRGDIHALRLTDLAELRGRMQLTRLPGAPAPLAGLANMRGATVPVYDLGSLLDYPPPEAAPQGWCALAAAAPVALAFEGFEGHLRLAEDAAMAGDGADAARPHIDELLRLPGRAVPVIDLPSIIRAIGALAGADEG